MHILDRCAAHGAHWQDVELIFRWLLQHGNLRTIRESVVYASLRPAETFVCSTYENVQTIVS